MDARLLEVRRRIEAALKSAGFTIGRIGLHHDAAEDGAWSVTFSDAVGEYGLSVWNGPPPEADAWEVVS